MLRIVWEANSVLTENFLQFDWKLPAVWLKTKLKYSWATITRCFQTNWSIFQSNCKNTVKPKKLSSQNQNFSVKTKYPKIVFRVPARKSSVKPQLIVSQPWKSLSQQGNAISVKSQVHNFLLHFDWIFFQPGWETLHFV